MSRKNLTGLSITLIVMSCALWLSPALALDDPTRPPTAKAAVHHVATKKVREIRWTLYSTLVSAERRTAVINNRVVSKGDKINGATVVSIQPSAVRLRNKGREVTLMIFKKDIKTLSPVDPLRQTK